MHRLSAAKKLAMFGFVPTVYGGTVYRTVKSEAEYCDYLENLRSNPPMIAGLVNKETLDAAAGTLSSSVIVEIDQLPTSQSITEQSLKREVIEAAANCTLSASEIDTSLNVVLSDERTVSLLPKNFLDSEDNTQRLKNGIRKIMNTPETMRKISKNHEALEAGRDAYALYIAAQSVGTDSSDNSNSHFNMPHIPSEWEELQAKYKCAVCSDVLAASNIIKECSHSCCGMCLIDHQQHGNSDQNSPPDSKCNIETDNTAATVLFTCPCPGCTSTYKESTYQRTLDESIQTAVDAAPDCFLKRAWYDRQAKYLQWMKEREQDEDAEEEDTFERVFRQTAHWIVYAVITVIILMRSSRIV